MTDIDELYENFEFFDSEESYLFFYNKKGG